MIFIVYTVSRVHVWHPCHVSLSCPTPMSFFLNFVMSRVRACLCHVPIMFDTHFLCPYLCPCLFSDFDVSHVRACPSCVGVVIQYTCPLSMSRVCVCACPVTSVSCSTPVSHIPNFSMFVLHKYAISVSRVLYLCLCSCLFLCSCLCLCIVYVFVLHKHVCVRVRDS